MLLFSFFFYKEYKEDYRESLANKFNIAKSQYSSGDKSKVIQSMEELIDSKDSTYSPLALYFLIDNKIVISKNKKFFCK